MLLIHFIVIATNQFWLKELQLFLRQLTREHTSIKPPCTPRGCLTPSDQQRYCQLNVAWTLACNNGRWVQMVPDRIALILTNRGFLSNPQGYGDRLVLTPELWQNRKLSSLFDMPWRLTVPLTRLLLPLSPLPLFTPHRCHLRFIALALSVEKWLATSRTCPLLLFSRSATRLYGRHLL